MKQKVIPFDELRDQVLELLKSERYMDSTLTVYRRTYNRIHVFLNQNGTDFYTRELGRKFLNRTEVCSATLSAYKCAVRRLDDYLDGKPYRCHRTLLNNEGPDRYSAELDSYLDKCKRDGNKEWTIAAKKRTCILFLGFIEKAGCASLSDLDASLVSQALLIYANKDNYSRVRMFLRFLAEDGVTKTDLSRIVPHHKKPVPIPSTYAPEEIVRIEKAVDTSTDTGRRDLAIIRLASRMGLRSGDIAGLRFSNVDFDTGIIHIVQQKTGVPLTLEMPEPVSEALLSYLNHTGVSEDGYIFHSMTAPYERITTSIIRHAVSNAFSAAGINTRGKKHGPHSFRSSLASSMVNDGSSYEMTRRILGHTDPNVIKRYAKADIENLRLCAIEPPKPSGIFEDYLSGRRRVAHVQ